MKLFQFLFVERTRSQWLFFLMLLFFVSMPVLGAVDGNPITADFNFKPGALTPASQSKWVTAYITLPQPFAVGEVDIDSIRLQGSVTAEGTEPENDVIILKFSKVEVIDLISQMGMCETLPTEVELKVTGQLEGAIPFEGSDIVTYRLPNICTDSDGDCFAVVTRKPGLPPRHPSNRWTCGKIDCDDTNKSVRPEATEICDTVDNDCDGAIDEDLESTPEVCDGLDNDCDGAIDEDLNFDSDGDGYSSLDSCEGTRDDCDDWDANIHPYAKEIPSDLFDNDCDGFIDEPIAPVPKLGVQGPIGSGDADEGGVGWPWPRFKDQNNGTVIDNLTGLVWLKNADCFGRQWLVEASFSASLVYDGSLIEDCGIEDGSVAGDWRLPNIRELQSLIDYTSHNPALHPSHPFENVKFDAIHAYDPARPREPVLYWSSTLNRRDSEIYYYAVDFTYGHAEAVLTSAVSEAGEEMHAWLVRDARDGELPPVQPQAPVQKSGQTNTYWTLDDGMLQKGVAWPEPRFSDNGDGTVTDNLTGLIWLQDLGCFPDPLDWDSAVDEIGGLANGQCNLLDGSEPGDWRLPSVRELESLIDYGAPYSATRLFALHLPTAHPFENVLTDGLGFWSSTGGAGSLPLFLAWGSARTDSRTQVPDKWPYRLFESGYYHHDELPIGYLLKDAQPGTLPLSLLWSSRPDAEGADGGDSRTQVLDLEHPAESGYLAYGGPMGYIFEHQQPGTLPLWLLWRENRSDSRTQVLDAGHQAEWRYALTSESPMGYIPTHPNTRFESLRRWVVTFDGEDAPYTYHLHHPEEKHYVWPVRGGEMGCPPTPTKIDADGDDFYGFISCVEGAYPIMHPDADCYDRNPGANPNASHMRPDHRGDGSFDYNCDGYEERRSWVLGDCWWPFQLFPPFSCDCRPGWDSEVPACGAKGLWIDSCEWRSCDGCELDDACDQCDGCNSIGPWIVNWCI